MVSDPKVIPKWSLGSGGGQFRFPLWLCSACREWPWEYHISFLSFHLIASSTTSDYVITNVQVVITRTLAEAEELGTALPRWFYLSYFNRFDWDVWKGYWLNAWHSCLIILYRYLKDRGEVEREYAKALRKLVAKYQVIDLTVLRWCMYHTGCP